MTETTIDLSKFCGGSGRYEFSQPFILDGWKYATNGMVAVRIPAPGEPNTEGTFPPMHTLAWERCALAAAPFMPGQPIIGRVKCPDCKGEGRIGGEPCEECDGSGRHECSCGDYHDCNECDGDGYLGGDTCKTCHGRKEVDGVTHFKHDTFRVVRQSEERLLTLPNLLYIPPEEGKSLVALKFDGGEAVVSVTQLEQT